MLTTVCVRQGSMAIQVVSALAPPFSMDMVKDFLWRSQSAAEDDDRESIACLPYIPSH